ncbi:MAG: PhoH family protein, partial [Thermofilaceae archaeon]
MSGEVVPANEKQKQFLAALESRDVDVVGAFGPSGTGKSFITCLFAIKAISEGKYSRFVIVRPLVDVSSGKRYTAI